MSVATGQFNIDEPLVLPTQSPGRRVENACGFCQDRGTRVTKTAIILPDYQSILVLEKRTKDEQEMNESQDFRVNVDDQLDRLSQLEAAAARYAELYELAPVGYFTLLHDSKITQSNLVGSRLLNSDVKQLQGERFSDFVAAPFRPAFCTFLSKLFSGASHASCEVELVRGEAIPKTINIEAALSSDGMECRAVITDITKRRQGELSLRASENRYKTLIEHTPFCVHEIDLDGRIESVNRAGMEMLEVDSEDQICGTEYLALVSADDIPRIEKLIQKAIEGEPSQFEFTCKGKQSLTVRSSLIPIQDEVGSTIRLLGISENVTNRKRAEETIRISTQLLEASQSIGKLGGWELDLETQNLYWTAETYRIHDTSPDQFNPTVDAGVSYFLPESRALITDALQAAMERGEGYDLELETLTTAGRKIDVRTTCAVTMRDGRPSKLTGIFQDITERKRVEVALRENQAQLQLAIQSANIGPWSLDLVTGEVYFSPEWKRQIGYEDHELLNKYSEWVDHMHPEDREHILARLQSYKEDPSNGYSVDFRFRHKDGSYRWIHTTALLLMDADGKPARMFGAHLDYTERKNAEEHLLRSQRMESLGTLAGGVAHDLNNALAPILIGVELLRMEYPEAGDTVDLFEASAKRGADMVRQLLTFAKGTEGERVSVQVGHLIKEMHGLIRGTFPKSIQLQINSGPVLPSVLGDTTQLHRVLLNLCINARDAMPDGGTLFIDSRVKEISADDAEHIHDAQPGKYVVVEVRDTGEGMQPEILDRIMDPFFTTKGPHEGTGLGLSTVTGILKGHGGFLSVDSQLGGGSVFKVHLPAQDSPDDTAGTSEPEQSLLGDGKVILFVDDEVDLRRVAALILQRKGFKPVTAVDGADGLIKALKHQAELQAVILDLHMPTMDGLEFARKLRQILPAIPILVSSGRMEPQVAEEFRSLSVHDFLDKPFTEGQLTGALKAMFNRKSEK